MKNLKKVGLTALAASLATVSVNAGELSVSGGASIGWTSKEHNNSSGWYMNDKIVFTGSGTLDNGLGFEMNLSIDESDVASDQAASGRTFEGRSIKLTSDTLGSLTFQGKDGTGVTGAYDDKMPTVYEETWTYATANSDGPNTADSFYYSNAVAVDGVQFDVSYTPGGSETSQNSGTLEYGVVVTAIEGLTIGAAMGEDQSARDSEVDNTILYATYAMGPVTVGYQVNDHDSTINGDDEDFTAAAITYAVSEDLTIMAATSTVDSADKVKDQEIDSFGIGYSMGSMSIALQTFDVDNNAGSSAAKDSYRVNELNISFAF